MAITINSVALLQQYLDGVMGRANHHAQNVQGVALALLGAVLWKNDGAIEVREYNGRPANMIWFSVGNNRYLMKYNHASQEIELFDRTANILLYTFSNGSTYSDVINAFNSL